MVTEYVVAHVDGIIQHGFAGEPAAVATWSGTIPSGVFTFVDIGGDEDPQVVVDNPYTYLYSDIGGSAVLKPNVNWTPTHPAQLDPSSTVDMSWTVTGTLPADFALPTTSSVYFSRHMTTELGDIESDYFSRPDEFVTTQSGIMASGTGDQKTFDPNGIPGKYQFRVLDFNELWRNEGLEITVSGVTNRSVISGTQVGGWELDRTSDWQVRRKAPTITSAFDQKIGIDYEAGVVTLTSGTLDAIGVVETTIVADNAITDTTLISSDTDVEFENALYGRLEELLSTNFEGNGFQTEFFYTSNYSPDLYVASNGLLGIIHQYTLKNTSTGGAQATVTGTWGSSATFSWADSNWDDVSNAQTQDGNFASANVSGGGVDDIFFYNFDFTSVIPTGATLIDIQARVKGKATGGGGTPDWIIKLGWDGADFSTGSGDIISNYYYEPDLTGTNTTYSGGYDVPITPFGTTVTTSGEHWAGSWGKRVSLSPAGFGRSWRHLTMDMVRDSDFGVIVVPDGGYTGGTYFIDYVDMVIIYTTEDIVSQSVQYAGENFGNNNYTETTNNAPSNRTVFTLTDGDTYNYQVQQLRSTIAADVNDDIEATGVSSNRVLTIREYKR